MCVVDTGSGKLKFDGSFCSRYNCCLRVLIMRGRLDIGTGTEQLAGHNIPPPIGWQVNTKGEYLILTMLS